MTDREKLVKLLDEAHDNYYKSFDPNRDFYGGVADHLIANGVTFAKDTNVGSKWISVEERLPTNDDADEVGHVMAAIKGDSFAQIFCWRSIARCPEVFTCWMPMPPKEEDNGK